MSRHRSRSPLHSRTSSLLGRRDEYYGEQYHAAVRSDPWRGSENIGSRNAEGGVQWDNGSSQADDQVDHWAKFIEAIGRAENRSDASASRHHAQDGARGFKQDPARCSRQLPRERLPSPESARYGMEAHKRVHSPGQRRPEHDGARGGRHYSRSSSPRHSQAKRHERTEHGFHNEAHEDRFDRSSYSERSLKSNYTQLHFKGFHELGPRQEEYTTSHRGFSPHGAPLIVEHDHGIPKHDDARILNPGRERPRSRDTAMERGHSRPHDPSMERPRSRDAMRDGEQVRSGGLVRDRELPRNRNPVNQQEHPGSHGPGRDPEYLRGGGGFVRHPEHPRSLDAVRDRERPMRGNLLSRRGTTGRGSSRSMERHKHGRDYHHQIERSRGSPGGLLNYDTREDSRFHNALVARANPVRPHKEQPRMGSHSRELHGRMDPADDDDDDDDDDDEDYRMEETTSAPVQDWKGPVQPRGNRAGVAPGHRNNPKRNPQRRPPSHHGSRTDFAGRETLKIQVDMSRPIGQSSHLGYSSERQLSLDLVNVGRQRLDFLPMLEHSGTFRESAMHSGTFAQEIITLVHQVKENYFQGQGVTLNERFSNEHEYSPGDEFADEEQDVEVLNRPLGSTSLGTQIFCKIGAMQSKPHFPAPGDLRHDLERKRLERLEGVKITIVGANVSQILPRRQETEDVYTGKEDPRETGWSEAVPEQTEHWDNPPPKRHAPNFNPRRNMNHAHNRPRQRGKRNPNNGPRW